MTSAQESQRLMKTLRPIETFQGPRQSLTVDAGASCVSISRISSDELGAEVLLHSEPEDAVALIYQVRNLASHDLWLDGRHQKIPSVPKATIQVLNLDCHGQARLHSNFDSINVRVPRVAVRSYAELSGLSGIETIDVASDWSVIDPMINNLEGAIIFMLANPDEVSPLVRQHLVFTLLAYLTTTYGSSEIPASLRKGKLATWQLRRAKDLLSANLEQSIGLVELSRRCDLSPSHFSRAFKATTGLSPTEWLRQYQIEKATTLLLERDTPLADIALRCGFSDQSHFSRAFKKAKGVTPLAWRRANAKH